MKSTQLLHALSAAALFSLFSTSHAADRLEEWSKFLPKNTLATIHIKNAPELAKDWEKSSVGRFLADEEVKKWMAPGLKEGGSSMDKLFLDESGMTFSENLAVYPGASLAAFVVDDFAAIDEKKGPGYIAISEIAGKEAEFKASKGKSLEAKKKQHADAEIVSTDLAGHEVSAIAESKAADAPWLEAWAIVDGIVLESNSKDLLESTLADMKGGAGEAGIVKKLNRVVELAEGTPDLSICLDVEPLIDLAQKGIEEGMGKGGTQMPFTADMILDALGLRELLGLAISMDLTDERGSSDFILIHSENPSGLLPSMIRGTSTEVPQPSFVPAGVDSVSVSRQSLGAVWDSILKGVEKLGPMAAMMTAQIGMMEQQVGMTIKNDLFGTLDDTMVDMQILGAPAAGSVEPNISKVTMIKLKDRARFNAALEAIKKMMGNGFAMFEESDFEGQKIFSVKPSLTPGAPAAAGGANSTKFSYVIADEYVLFAQGGPELLHKVLTRLKKAEGDSAWDNAETQDAIAALPKDYTGLSVSRGGSLVKMLLTTFAQLQEMGGKKAAKGKGKGPEGKGGEAKASDKKWFDAAATPSDEVFNKYFGTGASGVYALPDAVQVKYITLPVPAQ